MKQSNSLEFFRYFFMLIIAIGHSSIRLFNYPYLPVDFFFILSGYLLYNSYITHHRSTINYTIAKLKKFYFEYIIAFIIYFSFIHLKSIEISFNELIKLIPELLLIQNIGIYHGGINFPLWYLSVLIVGGALLYSFIVNLKDVSVKIIFPIIILLFYSCIFSLQDSIEYWKTIGCFNMTIMRGIADMSLGIILAYMHLNYGSYIKKNMILFNIVSVVSLILFISIMFTNDNYDKYMLIFIPPIITACMESDSWYNKILGHRIFKWLGSLSYTMLLFHVVYFSIFKRVIIFFPKIFEIPIYIVGLTLFCFFIKYFVDYLKKSFNLK